MMANDSGLDFERIRQGLGQDYPRAADMPAAGFAAGPCLFKDTMQLAAFNNNNFALGHTAMTINEGMPLYLVHRLEQRFDLTSMTVGILGMAFKGGSDDTRSSLSYKLKRILAFKAGGGAVHRPVRDHRPGPAARCRTSSRSRTCWSSPRRIPTTASWSRTSRSRTSGTSWARAYGYERRAPPRDGRHPRLQRGRADRPGPGPALRVGAAAVRGPGRRGQPGRHDGPGGRGVRGRRSPGCATWSTPTAAGRPTRSGSASTPPRPRSPW